MGDDGRTFGTQPIKENPFLIKSSESSLGIITGATAAATETAVNPFISHGKSVSSSVGFITNTKGFNIFGKPQDNSAILGSTINAKPSSVPSSDMASKNSVSVDVKSEGSNPFFSAIGLQQKSLPIIAKAETKSIDSLPNPFLSSEIKTKSEILPNPFLNNKVPPAVVAATEQLGEKVEGKSGGLLPQTSNNPFLSVKPPAMFSHVAPIPSQTFGIRGEENHFFTSVLPSELTKSHSNTLSRNITHPGKLENKRERSSLDGLKPSLSLLAESLKSVICTDSESKYDVLEKIDKAIRKGVKSNFHVHDGKRYRALKGTCMDMCPEKERYFRNDKHQISPFELSTVQDIVSTLEGDYPQLDHHKAIKEYSRSSADQEEPLPHQLRTVSVLNYTMNYLVSNVMDVKYSKRTDWFDFLWNRTRAIRKDITQQNLSCMETISVIEKCARFHIFCSHYLCEHELHVFDSKLNLENLTKCLQTLKHMYEDRWKENKEICSNEAEFRCYQILLNLHDNDMLREVMHFRKEIRESVPVKFALKIFTSFKDNNYVRFFKLLKSTSYLNACLLQPYFRDIRYVALRVMVRTFSHPNTDVPYPLENLLNMLAFDNIEEADLYCETYGLKTFDAKVYFNRSSFTIPEEPFQLKMSVVVSEKLQSSMAEIVNNGLVNFNLRDYEPINSFSVDGVYIGNYHLLDDDTFNESVIEEVRSDKTAEDGIGIQGVPSSVSSIININDTETVVIDDHVSAGDNEDIIKDDESVDEGAGEDISSLRDDPDYVASEDIDEGAYDDEEYSGQSEYSDDEDVMFLREDFLAYIDELIEEEILECADILAVNVMDETKDEMIQSEVMTNQELAIMCIEQTRMAVVEVIDEEQLKLEKEKEEMMAHESEELSDFMLEESVNSVLCSICHAVYQNEIDILEAGVLNEEIEDHVNCALSSAINQEMSQISSEIITEAHSNRDKLLESNRQSIMKKKVSKMFHRWIKAYKQQQFIKSSLIDFPPMPPLITTREAVHKLHPDGDISYSLPNFSGNVKKIIQPKLFEKDSVTNISLDITGNDTSKERFSKPLSSILEDGMSLLFFKDFHEHCLHCETLVLPLAPPNDIIRLYNNTLVAIKDGVKPVFNAEDSENLDYLVSLLELPLLGESEPYNWDLCCLECEEFVSNVADQKSSILFSRVNNILDRHISQSSENEDIVFPWSEILEACVFSKMSSMYLGGYNVEKISFQSDVSCEYDIISSIRVVNPLKEHIKVKRAEYYTLKNSLTYRDDMKRKKFNREYNLRKSLDSVDRELDKLKSTVLRKSTSPKRIRSSSLQDLFNESTSFLENVEHMKQNCTSYGRSVSSSCLNADDFKENENVTEKLRYEKQTGLKRSFEFSMMECLKDINDYRMKLKTRDEYWREIINQ